MRTPTVGERTAVAAEQLIPLLERKRMFDSAWIVCLVASLGTVSVLWFLSALEIDIARTAWYVFAYAAAYLVVATATDRLNSTTAIVVAMQVKMIASVVFLGMLWHLVGGLRNPMFLIVFVLPVIISGIMLVGIQAHVIALVSVAVVGIVAVGESSELRWYLSGFHVPIGAVSAFFPAGDGDSTGRSAELVAGPAYEFTMIATFGIMQLIVAFLSTPLAGLLLRVNARFETSGKLLSEVQGLFHAILRADPDPCVIVYADSGQVVQASDSFFQRMLLRPSQLAGKGLFEIVDFDEPEQIRRALEAPSGEIPSCVYRVGQETRIANVSFHRTEHAGTAYIYFGWQELTELWYLQAAFNAVDDPLLVIAATGRMLYANRPARLLFGALHFGMDLTEVPPLGALVAHAGDWGADDGMARRLEINGEPYAVHSLTAPLPGAFESGTILWLHSVAREETLFDQATRDPLTGIYNRRYFDDAVTTHIERSKRGHKLSLAYFDLDDFKVINDRMGHAAGDAALIAFVQAVKGQLREMDVFARRGGDEFAVLFVDCDTDVASAAIDRLRGVLTRDGCVCEGRKVNVSFSAGLAACHTDDNVERLLERADRAVYAAKERGKGRLVVQR